jgi:hypothetical protein
MITIPGPTVQPGLPLKESTRSDPATISESLARKAICAAPTTSGSAPNALERFTRSLWPPMLVRTIMRTV